MQTITLDFPRNARRVYTAVKHVFQTKTRFGNIDWDDVHFTVEARRGWFVSPFHGVCQGEGGGNGDGAEQGDELLWGDKSPVVANRATISRGHHALSSTSSTSVQTNRT